MSALLALAARRRRSLVGLGIAMPALIFLVAVILWPRPSPISSTGVAAVAEEFEPDPEELYQVRNGFSIERFASGLDLPVNLALAPGAGADPTAPFLYVTELYGQVRVLTLDGTVSTYAEGLLNYDPSAQFPGAGEGGVSGIVVDPESGDLLVSLVYLEDDALKNRVLRLESSPDGMLAVGQQVVMEGIPAGASHQVHALTIGPDGKLYVNVADGDHSPAAQDDDDLRGKILRLNLDGSIPADNPTPGDAVFAKGFRNPFGAAWHPDQPWLYASDNGPVTGDRILKVQAGGNYGWCCTPSQNALLLFDRNDALSPTAIAFDFERLLTAEGETHLFVSISGLTYAAGSLENSKKILDLRLNADGEVEEVSELLHYVGNGRSSVIGIAFGPDGLYFSDLYGETGFDEGPVAANIYRVFPDPDDDNDGCTNKMELNPKALAATGGGRDPLYYWDFMDMWVNKQKDRRVNIIDTGALVPRFGAAGDPNGDPLDPPQALAGYHVSADRSPPKEGANVWNAGPPNGDINIIEIGLAVAQFGHTCAGLP